MPQGPTGADAEAASAPEPDPDRSDPGPPESTPTSGLSRRRASRRLSLLLGAVCLAILVLGLVWIAVTGLLARSKLQDAQRQLPTLRAALLDGDLARAKQLAASIEAETADAHAWVSGPAWWVAANLPGAGDPLRTARVVATTAHRVGAQVLPGVVTLAGTVHDASLHSGDSVDLSALQSAQPIIGRAQQGAQSALDQLRATSSTSWLSVVDRNRDAFVRQLSTLDGDLSGASLALRTALPMMGASGTRRYFVGFENEAEMRGLGGLPGAFAIVTVTDGRFRFTHFGNDNEFQGVHADVNLGADYEKRYATAAPASTYANSDIGPDFSDAARIWAGMWLAKSGQRVDGAVAIDPTALSYLLRVTGPAPLPGGGAVTADNVVALTQQTQYSKYPDVARRKQYVLGVSDAISKRITSGKGSTTGLLKAFSRAAKERRLVVWSSHATEEQDLVTAGYAGALNPTGGSFSGFTVVNAAGNKLDYYLDRSMTYSRPTCAPGSTATATLTLKNDAPRSGLPAYVTLRADKPKYKTRPGDNFVIVSYYGSPGSTITSVTVDGKPVGLSLGREHDLITVSFGLELPVGSTQVVKVQISDPQGGKTTVLQQPGVRPLRVDLDCQKG